MTISRGRTILYIILIIAILVLILGLLSNSTKEGLEDKNQVIPVANVQPNPESEIQPKTYAVELLQVKDSAVVPGFGIVTPDIFNPETAYYINTVSRSNPKLINKKAIIKVDTPAEVVLQMETKRAESFIVIAPQEGGKFPAKFTFKLTNNMKENKLGLNLWGSSPVISAAPSNSIIGSDNYTVFPYPKEMFKTKDEANKMIDGIMVGGVNIGNNALNIIGIGRLFDRQFTDIGEVQNINDVMTITCDDSKGVTGILIYLGKAATP
jgi:hypothetical protein